MILIRNRALLRELLWFTGTIVAFFALFSWVLDLGGGPGDPFDWIAVVCFYAFLIFVRVIVWALKNRKARQRHI